MRRWQPGGAVMLVVLTICLALSACDTVRAGPAGDRRPETGGSPVPVPTRVLTTLEDFATRNVATPTRHITAPTLLTPSRVPATNAALATSIPLSAPTPTSTPVVTHVNEYDSPELFDSLLTLSERISLNPASLDFGDQPVQTISAARMMTLTNTGHGALSISSITTSGDFAQTYTCPLRPSTLAAGASCIISVIFRPAASGSHHGSLAITESVTGQALTVPLSGIGTAP